MSWLSYLGRTAKLWSGSDPLRNEAVRQVVRESMDGMPPLLSEISEFWFAKRAGDAVPDWMHFSPRAHTKFLPHIVLWEVVDDGYFARITGEAVATLLPIKLANQRLHDVLTDDLSFLPADLDFAMESSAPIYTDRPNAWVLGDDTIHTKAVHLPFRASHSEINRVLTVFAFAAEPKIEL